MFLSQPWKNWRTEVTRYLLKKQNGDGGREDGAWEDGYGKEFGTAVAVLILEIPIQYLPIFQR